MSTSHFNPAKRLYKLLKVYSALAALGAVSVLVYGFILWSPGIILSVLAGLIGAFYIILLLRPHKLHITFGSKEKTVTVNQKEPKESVLIPIAVKLSTEERVGDLIETFSHLHKKFGHASAVIWLFLQTLSLIKTLIVHRIAGVFRGIIRISRD